MSQSERYSKLMVAFHWLLAVLIFISLFAGQFVVSGMSNEDPEKVQMLGAHAMAGLAIGLLMIVRLIIRFRSTLPPSVNAGNAIALKLEHLTHWGFYVIVLLMVFSGIGTMILSGAGDVVRTGEGSLPADFSVYPPMNVHFILSKLLFLMVFLHIAAVIKHRVVSGHSLMARMKFK
jgi:cytochrome b561